MSTSDTNVSVTSGVRLRTNKDDQYWTDILAQLDAGKTMDELQNTINAIERKGLEELPELAIPVFNPRIYQEDKVAIAAYDLDEIYGLVAIDIYGDGNCFCHSLSTVCFGTDKHHKQLRACIVIEGCRNKDKYLNDTLMSRGVTVTYQKAKMPVTFAQYSDN